MLVTTRKLGQVLNIYESNGGSLMCQLLVKRAECCNTFEGLTDEGERAIASELELTVEISYIDENRCRLRGIATRKFVVHAGDCFKVENSNGEVMASITVFDITAGGTIHRTENENFSVAKGRTDLGIDVNERLCSIGIKEK